MRCKKGNYVKNSAIICKNILEEKRLNWERVHLKLLHKTHTSILNHYHQTPGRISMLLLLLSRFSRVRFCATPETAAHQAPPSLGFSSQEHWTGLPFPSPVHESKKWKWSRSVVSDSEWPHRLQPTRLFCPWNFPGKSTAVGCLCLLLQPWN